MSLSEQLLVHIGRQQKDFQVIPSEDLVALNPQPIPPREHGLVVGLSSQLIPPREYGVLAARELLRLHWQAGKLGIEAPLVSSWEEDPCPVGKKPPIPPYFPPIPGPEPGPDWNTEYLLGVSSTLAVAQDGSPFLSDALDHASRALGKSLS